MTQAKGYRELLGDYYYACYTAEGNALCRRLTEALEADILAGTLTPAAIKERFQSLRKEVQAIDDGMYDSEPYYAVAGILNQACRQAGYAPVVNGD